MKTIIFFLLVLFIFFSPSASAFFIIADVSPNRVEIDSKFRGKKILVFGALMEKADNIITVIHGPENDIAIHKKTKVFGFWTNGPKVIVNTVSSFFSFSSANKTYVELDKVFHGEFTPFSHISQITDEVKALTDSKVRNGLYQFENKIDIINDRLFRGSIFLPSNIVKGQYIVEVVALNENRIVGIEAMPLFVVQIGLDARISELAKSHPLLYSLIAVLGALSIGWAGFALSSAVQSFFVSIKKDKSLSL